jgi:hypothetical protein
MVLLVLYAVTVFFSAALLFAVQPMFARMALPLLGGSANVWNTALVFYQATLLAGYVYADLSTRLLGVRRQALVHIAVLLAPLAVLPIGIASGWAAPIGIDPTVALLGLLTGAVGLPFFAVSTTAPLLQRWFTKTGHPAAADPYFLYAASNVGSFLALLSYPLIVERLVPLTGQARWWAIGYGVFVVLVLASALGMLRRNDISQATTLEADYTRPPGAGIKRRARWVVLALIPSSLMLGATTHVSTELAAVPLLWIVPLSIYLLSFVLVFSRRPPPHRLFVRLLPIMAFAVTFTLAVKAIEPIVFVIPLHLILLFVISMVCHGELARDRPGAHTLTEFYLWMAAGGVLGGAFNALIAPLLFRSVVEYPLMIVAAVLVAPPRSPRTSRLAAEHPRWMTRAVDLGVAIVLGAFTLSLLVGMEATTFTARSKYLVAFGVPALAAFAFSRQPVRYGLSLGAVLFVSATFGGSRGHVIHSDRTFFGVHRVVIDPSESYRQLLHGSTIHGLQSLDPARRREPLGYFSANGPAGQILSSSVRRPARIAVVGLGNGTLATYALPGESWTFFELDATVERIARDPRWFTFLTDSPGSIQVVLGDGRLSLKAVRDRYDLLILDAYSSEAIPLHLMSREALALYLARLEPHGVLALHISNRHFDLAPIVAALAEDAGLEWRVRREEMRDPNEVRRGNVPSTWAVLTHRLESIAALAADPRWRKVRPAPGQLWTDDYSSLLSALR